MMMTSTIVMTNIIRAKVRSFFEDSSFVGKSCAVGTVWIRRLSVGGPPAGGGEGATSGFAAGISSTT